MSGVACELCFVPGVSLLTVDDDHLRMRSPKMLGMLCLSSKVNPSKAVGPIQTTMHDGTLNFWLAGRYAKKGEGCDKSLFKFLMTLTGESFSESVTLPNGNIVSIDRGYMTLGLADLFNKRDIQYYCTHKRGKSFPFTTSSSKGTLPDQKLMEDDGVRMEMWGKRSCHRRNNYALAYREAHIHAVATMATNVPWLNSQNSANARSCSETVSWRPFQCAKSILRGCTGHQAPMSITSSCRSFAAT